MLLSKGHNGILTSRLITVHSVSPFVAASDSDIPLNV